MLHATLHFELGPTAELVTLVVPMQRVLGTVRSTAQHRAPVDEHRHSGGHGRGHEIVRSRPHLIPHAPRMVTGRDPIGEFAMHSIDLGPSGSAAGVVVTNDVGIQAEAIAGAVMFAVLQRGWDRGFEGPLETDRDDVVGRKREANDLQGFEYFVGDRPDRGGVGGGAEFTA